MAKTFFVLLRQLVAPAGESESRLPARVADRIGCEPEDIVSFQVVRRSLDARKRRGKAVNVYHIRLELPNRLKKQLRKTPGLDLVFDPVSKTALSLTDPAPKTRSPRPLVVGAGPAGLFATLRLARAGWKPILIDRGDDLDRRRGVTADFWRQGNLDPESNVLYGEGGAGLFSDGKLNTRHKDREGMRAILGVLVEAGAPESILVDAEPHVGSDLLGEVVANVREEILRFGGEIRYRCRLSGLLADDGAVREAVLQTASGTENLAIGACILACGHSARDVYEMLDKIGLRLEAKPFAVGLRVEIPQEEVDASQRIGRFKPGPGEAASFRLSRPPEGVAAACYTFCMCPGGQVIACASEPGRLAVNGMSLHARAGDWANAAFLSPVTSDDFADIAPAVPPALAGIAFQRHWEEKAYQAGLPEGPYAVPCAGLEDFLRGGSASLPVRRGTGRAAAADLRTLLPERIAETLVDAVPAMLARMRSVRPEHAVLYGVESRTSSPVRIVRDEGGQATGLDGVYPAGEGAGYAGGIMTSALDGWKAAACLMAGTAKTV